MLKATVYMTCNAKCNPLKRHSLLSTVNYKNYIFKPETGTARILDDRDCNELFKTLRFS